MTKFSKAAGYKSRIVKEIVFIYICNEQFESETKETIHLTLVTKIIKY